MDEAKFKKQLRASFLAQTALAQGYEWPVTDPFRTGTADFFLAVRGCVMACEAKHMKELPVRENSRVLDHPVSMEQYRFLRRYQESGSPSFVLIGVGKDAAAYTNRIQLNYTKKELMFLPRLQRLGKDLWDMGPLITIMADHNKTWQPYLNLPADAHANTP